MLQMAQERTKPLNRVRRVRGQIDAVERAIEWGNSCTDVLQTVSATRGALNGVMSEVVHRSLLSEITARTEQRLAITNWSLTIPRRDVRTERKGMFDKEKDDDIR